jgi:hypothetical protein
MTMTRHDGQAPRQELRAVLRRRGRSMRARILRLGVPLLAFTAALSSCEDEGNPGNDNLLTGASLIVVVVVVLVIVLLVRRKR